MTSHIPCDEGTLRNHLQAPITGKFQCHLRQTTCYSATLLLYGNFDVGQHNRVPIDPIVEECGFSIYQNFEPAGNGVIVDFQVRHFVSELRYHTSAKRYSLSDHLPIAMITDKKPNHPPVNVIPEDSGPPLTDIKEPKKNPEGEGLDIDDAQIEKPKDDAFKKAPQKQ